MKGIYILIIEINKYISAKIGALGELTFNEGLYAYVGSAQNNLELRVARHLRNEKRLFWHVDYLLNSPAAKVINAFYLEGDKAQECKIANILAQKAKPITDFGSSDCQCKSHLFQADSFQFITKQMHQLNTDSSNHRNSKQVMR